MVMGYILPVQHYQYQHYHQRVETKQQRMFYIEEPFKALLDNKHQALTKKYERFYRQGYDRYSIKPIVYPEPFIKLTAKGKSVDKVI